MDSATALDTQNADVQSSILSIRNALLGLTIILVLIILALSFTTMRSASALQAQAERSMYLNDTNDQLTAMLLAVAEERMAMAAIYGFADRPPAELVAVAKAKRQSVQTQYRSLSQQLADFPDFDGRANFDKDLKGAYGAYRDMTDDVLIDIDRTGDARELRLRSIVRTQNKLIDAGANLMTAAETAFSSNDSQIEAVRRLKRKLWEMLEYSGRDSSAIAENIASGDPLSAIKLQLISQDGGVVRSSWRETQSILKSELSQTQFAGQIDAIEDGFFGDFDILRDDVYAAAEFEEPYPVTVMEWIEAGAMSAKPVQTLSADATAFAQTMNQEAVSAAGGSFVFALSGFIVTLAIGAVAVWVVVGRVVQPVNGLSSTMEELAIGRLETDVPFTDRADEVGAMARSVQVFKENAIERQRLEVERHEAEKADVERQAAAERERLDRETAERERAEEQEQKARAERREEMLAMADQFESALSAVVNSVSQSASDMESAAQNLTATAKQTTEQSQTVANAAEQASGNANMVAASAEELSSSVREITEQTNQSSSSARDAVGRTDTAVRDVAELESAAQKIGEVVQLINDIAEQTNLLALNATIEAARAGDAGKGFAVVASEVKSLAAQTANATDEISAQVAEMQNATSTAVSAINDIRGIISEIEATATSIASAVEEQDASTQEIARNVAEVSSGTGEVSSIIRGVYEGASTTGTAAGDVLQAAQALTAQSDTLRSEVDGFLSQIRSTE